ncbi:MAG: hypothetical protein HY558_04925 [Euryarchaeota archaeon]|nr:hypothetical protein [Euryarchaeota archaeon]
MTTRTPQTSIARRLPETERRLPQAETGGAAPLSLRNGNLLRVFAGPDVGTELTIQEIMNRASRSYKPTYYALMRLVREGYLTRHRQGWKHLFRLNLANPFVRKHLELIELERRESYLASLTPEARGTLERTLDEVTEEVPVMAIILLNGVKDVPSNTFRLLAVVPEADGFAGKIAAIARRLSNGITIQTETTTLEELRSAIQAGEDLRPELNAATRNVAALANNTVVTLFGYEFFLRERVRALRNGKVSTSSKLGGSFGAADGNENGHTSGPTNGNGSGTNGGSGPATPGPAGANGRDGEHNGGKHGNRNEGTAPRGPAIAGEPAGNTNGDTPSAGGDSGRAPRGQPQGGSRE